MIQLLITSDVNPSGIQRRFDENLTLDQLKTRLVLATGVEPADMKLRLTIGDASPRFFEKEDEQNTLKQLIGEAGEVEIKLHVQDQSGQSSSLLDEQAVPKYEMSDEAYEKRANSLRAFKKQNKLGRFKEAEGLSN